MYLGGINEVGMDSGVPNASFPHLTPASLTLSLLPPSILTSLPLENFSLPHRKRQVTSSYYISFQCMNCLQQEHEIFKTVGQFLCLFLRSFIYFFFQPTKVPSRQHCSHIKPCTRWNFIKPKPLRRPASSPDSTANCRPEFRPCGQDVFMGFYLHTWDVQWSVLALASSSPLKWLGYMTIAYNTHENPFSG